MQTAVKERIQSQHSSIPDQRIPTKQFAERCYSKGYKKKNERQNAGSSQKKLDGIGSQSTVKGVKNDQCQRHQGVDRDQDLIKSNIVHLLYDRLLASRGRQTNSLSH